jgi:hypothetical protein
VDSERAAVLWVTGEDMFQRMWEKDSLLTVHVLRAVTTLEKICVGLHRRVVQGENHEV